MPTYGYRCGTCGHEFEIVQKISDEPLKTCPKCQGKLSKMAYPAGVIFKGSGYYTTDYKSSSTLSESSSNGSTSSTGDTSEKSSESKSDSKSDSRAKGKTESKSSTKSEGKSDSKTEKAS